MSKEKNLFLKLIPIFVTVVIMVGIVVIFMKTAERQRRLARIKKVNQEKILSEQPQNVPLADIEEHAELARISDGVVLSPNNREMPGKMPATVLLYKNKAATNIVVTGSWDHWTEEIQLTKKSGQWLWDFRDLELTEGFYEFKFIHDKEYEGGLNRTLYINDTGYAERPLSLIASAKIDALNKVNVLLAHAIDNPEVMSVKFVPTLKIKETKWITEASSGKVTLQIVTKEPIDLSTSYSVVLDNVALRPAVAAVMPGAVLGGFQTKKPLGAIVSERHGSTQFRVFAPRAKSVVLCLYDTPEFSVGKTTLVAKITYPMKMVPRERYWSVKVKGKLYGQYYSFMVDGPNGRGEGFNKKTRVGDPYARAAAYAANNTIIIDEKATNQWFGGWTDTNFEAIAWQDAVIYETHVRDLTIDKSSLVPDELRGKFAGIIASDGTGTGIDHLRDMGINMIEFMPIAEFCNGTNSNEHGWGYNSSYFFAPESSYGQEPLTGSQYYEFKSLVNYLHEQGFGVILDVVYNHVGSPHIFSMLDKNYYFRIGSDFTPLNYSGYGNDVRTELPMVRRFIVENILYWMREFHVDGFRFDNAELIDMDTLMEIRDAARKENPNVLLISEPWSIRGDHKLLLKGKGWASWNNDFRDTVKEFVLGNGDRTELKEVIQGTVTTWADNPMQSVNYLESHDNLSFADEITSNPEHNGNALVEADAKKNILAATVLFTSLGIPMLSEGQEFIRSKSGITNSYNKGDEVNAIRWDDRDRPIASATMEYYKGLIALRKDPMGASLRLKDKAPHGYYKWILPENVEAIGYFINKKKEVEGATFLVLLNASDKSASFSVDFPAGLWLMVGDSKVIVATGIREIKIPWGGSKGSNIKLPRQSSYIFMLKPDVKKRSSQTKQGSRNRPQRR